MGMETGTAREGWRGGMGTGMEQVEVGAKRVGRGGRGENGVCW